MRYPQWFPAEADVSLRPDWFYHPDQRPKSPAQLAQRYEASVGRNAVLLLNVPPGPDGRITAPDLASLTRIRLGEDTTRGPAVERFAVDAWSETGWEQIAAGTTIGYSRILALPAPVTADRVRVRVERSRGAPHLASVGLYRT